MVLRESGPVVGAVGMCNGVSDLQGRWEERETVFWFSSLSTGPSFPRRCARAPVSAWSPVRSGCRGFCPRKPAVQRPLSCSGSQTSSSDTRRPYVPGVGISAISRVTCARLRHFIRATYLRSSPFSRLLSPDARQVCVDSEAAGMNFS